MPPESGAATPRSIWPELVLVALLAAFPWFGGKFYVDLAATIMILAIFALSLELLVGRTGLVSFGHAAFFGVAAYATALLSPKAEAASVFDNGLKHESTLTPHAPIVCSR